MKCIKKIGWGFFLVNSVCYADYFSAPLATADWKVNQQPYSCQLLQKIPLYGIADFSQQTGESLRFSISEQRFKAEIVKASLTVDAPPWRQQSIFIKDFLVALEAAGSNQNYPRLSVYGESAEFMLDALSKGLYPTFSYLRASVAGFLPQVSVGVSSINFIKNYQQFDDCRKDFLPGGFKQKLGRSLFFRPSSRALNANVLKQLVDTARYIKEVKETQIVIVSNTSIAGNRDKNWFLRRAKVIENKLGELGIAADKISIKPGVHRALADNKTIQLNVFGPDSLKSIYYRKGNIQLTPTEKQRLSLLLQYAENILPNSKIIISSHTDAKGKKSSNLKVSQQRGDVIKQYLMSQGVDEKKIQVRAYGERKPAKSNRFPTGRAQNRRAIIDLVG
jgi:outer membrane protein OmpA-like peptidoglycan-associated protein